MAALGVGQRQRAEDAADQIAHLVAEVCDEALARMSERLNLLLALQRFGLGLAAPPKLAPQNDVPHGARNEQRSDDDPRQRVGVEEGEIVRTHGNASISRLRAYSDLASRAWRSTNRQEQPGN